MHNQSSITYADVPETKRSAKAPERHPLKIPKTAQSFRLPFLSHLLEHITRGLDLALLLSLSTWLFAFHEGPILGATMRHALPYLLSPVFFVWANQLVRSYHFAVDEHFWIDTIRRLFATLIAVSGGYLVNVTLSFPLSVPQFLQLAGTLSLAQISIHQITRQTFKFAKKQGWLSENVLIVGATEQARKLIAANKTSKELNIVGIFDDRLGRTPDAVEGVPLLGKIDDLLTWPDLPDIDRIIVSVSSNAKSRVRSLIDRMRGLPQTLVLLLELDDFDPESQKLEQLGPSPAAYVSGRPVDLHRIIVKRIFDIFTSALLLVVLSPVLAILAILIRVDSNGPILFRQRRQGFNNQIIRVWKFRTMYHNPVAEVRMTAQTVADDPRVTRLGRVLRMTSLDELPQLVNVLRGDMSLVGPRPHAIGMTTESAEVQGIVSDYAHRHRVKPGLTGWAQVNGSRGPVYTKEEVRERVRLDLEYVNRSSIWFDVYILLVTLPCLLGDRQRQR